MGRGAQILCAEGMEGRGVQEGRQFLDMGSLQLEGSPSGREVRMNSKDQGCFELWGGNMMDALSPVTRLMLTSNYCSVDVYCQSTFPVLFSAPWQKPVGLQPGLTASLTGALHGPFRRAFKPACKPTGCCRATMSCTKQIVCCLGQGVACCGNRSKHC